MLNNDPGLAHNPNAPDYPATIPPAPRCRDCGYPCDGDQCDECRLGLCSVCGCLLAEGDFERDELCAGCRAGRSAA
jgi:hypothetical protein